MLVVVVLEHITAEQLELVAQVGAVTQRQTQAHPLDQMVQPILAVAAVLVDIQVQLLARHLVVALAALEL